MDFFLLVLGFLIVVYLAPVCLAIAAVVFARSGRRGPIVPVVCYLAAVAIVVGGAIVIATLQSAPPDYADGFKER